jgi:TatD DNase family protein
MKESRISGQESQTIVDTHAHVFVDQFSDDFEQVMERAYSAGISDIVMPCIVPESLELMANLPSGGVRLHKTAGIHPCDVATMNDAGTISSWLGSQVARNDIIAIGETGLDYYWSDEHVELQRQSLEIHLEIAKAHRKPVILHNRNSTEDLLNAVKKAQDGRLSGVWHCFTGTEEEARIALELGLFLGIGGAVTFKNGMIDKFINRVPLDRLVLETDSPYLAPVPHRGRRNEPSYIRLVAEKLAFCFEVSGDEVIRQTTANSNVLFGL